MDGAVAIGGDIYELVMVIPESRISIDGDVIGEEGQVPDNRSIRKSEHMRGGKDFWVVGSIGSAAHHHDMLVLSLAINLDVVSRSIEKKLERGPKRIEINSREVSAGSGRYDMRSGVVVDTVVEGCVPFYFLEGLVLDMLDRRHLKGDRGKKWKPVDRAMKSGTESNVNVVLVSH